MIKIKLFEPEIHRNETTFRPLLFAQDLFREVGIEFVMNDTSYDFVMVGQASIANKKVSLEQSVENGLNVLNKIKGDYFIVDGQDATTLIGTIDVFRHVYKNNNCKLFLKTSYLKDFDLYKKKWMLGRIYWEKGNYSVPDIDDMKPKMKLVGFNWLSTIQPQWQEYRQIPKDYDIFAMFQYPMNKKVFEHGFLQSAYYDEFRSGLMEKLYQLEKKYKVHRIKDGVRIPQSEYYNRMFTSKITIAPFGYGEMAPRDIESAIVGNVLLKNDMSHVLTIPNPYVENDTYIPIKWDWSDLEEKIDYVLSNYGRPYINDVYVERMRQKYEEENNFTKRVVHFYNLLKDLDGVNTE